MNTILTIEVEYIDGAYVVLEDSVEDAVRDICADADVDVDIEDTGIGAYEYWGSRGVDTCIEVTGATGSVTVNVEYNVTLSEADAARVEDGEDEDALKAAALEQAMMTFSWPSVTTSGSVEGPKRDFDYDVGWTCGVVTRIPTQLTFEAELG